VYPYILQILDAFCSGIPICTGNRKDFSSNRIGSFKLNNSMMTWHKYQRWFSYALLMYIHLKIPKSRETVPLSVTQDSPQ
jgi:hypothetical protein